MDNYFNYFTEIEEQFCRRRGTALLVSTLDWALMELWRDAGIPLEAVLRGIDEAFDSYDRRPSKTRKVNSLAYCAQEVLAAAEDMKEAAVGAGSAVVEKSNAGFESEVVAAYLRRNAELVEGVKLPGTTGNLAKETGANLRKMAEEIGNPQLTKTALRLRSGQAKGGAASGLRLEELERRLTVMEEKLFAALLAGTADEEIVTVKAEADRDLAPYRRKMPGAQIEQLQKQYVQKRLLEKYKVPRLSLFYM